MRSPTPIFELASVTKAHAGPPPVVAIRDCNLVVHEGDYVAITGPSGSGKSSLLNLIGLLDVPSEGRCLFRGMDVTRMSERARAGVRARSIGFVFQSFHLLPHRSLVENVTLPLLYAGAPRAARNERAMEALSVVGLANRSAALPSMLSGGEQQRVAIARAIVGRPDLVLCDEPTGNLDSRTASSIIELLEALNEDLTVVLITHDNSIARRAARRITLSDGRVCE
jgi:putative ABC transport system ATP-binding protein